MGTDIANAPLEGRIVEVACFAHWFDPSQCRGDFHRAVADPYAWELDRVEELIDICDAGLQSRYDGI